MIDLSHKTHIVIHHSLTKDSQTVSWGAIRRYHVETNKWKAIGYQIGIEIIGDYVEVLLGRMLHETAAAVKEQTMNTRGVHICFVGNFDLAAPPVEVWKKGVEVVAFYAELLKIPTVNVTPHTLYAPYKTCPGSQFDMTKFRADVSAKRNYL